jgi:hypothetical protein
MEIFDFMSFLLLVYGEIFYDAKHRMKGQTLKKYVQYVTEEFFENDPFSEKLVL